MSRNFTHYWQNETWFYNQEHAAPDELLDLTAGNLFAARGVSPGDYIFVVTVLSGRMYLCGKMLVGRLCGEADAKRVTGWDEMWEANEYVLASHATPMRFDRAVPLGLTARLRMANGRVLTFAAPGVLDSQTLRGVRELSLESASALDGLLPGLRRTKFQSGGRPK